MWIILISLLIWNYIIATHFLLTEDDCDVQTILVALIPYLFIIIFLILIINLFVKSIKKLKRS